MLRATLIVSTALSAGACVGILGGDDADSSNGGSCGTPEALVQTEAIMVALSPQCAGCHGAEAGRLGYFASLDAFVNLVVMDPALVIPGDPDQSRLLAILEGSADGSVSQMPLAGDPYFALPDAALSADDIRSWIVSLEGFAGSTGPDRSAPTIARLPAGLFEDAVPALLGIEFPTQYERNYAVLASDTTQKQGSDSLYLSMGGESSIHSSAGHRDADRTFTQYLLQLTARWCQIAVEQESETIFTEATPGTDLTSEADVRANLANMHLLLLGVEPSDDELDRYVESVFRPVSERLGSADAWRASCVAVLRDPRFTFY